MSAAEPRKRFSIARLVQGLLLVAFTGLSLLFAVVVAIDWLQRLDTYSWQRTTCTIVSSRVIESSESGDHALEVSYSYRHQGRSYRGDAYRQGGAGFAEIADAEREAARYPAGAEVPCWVDGDDPARAYLRRADLWQGLWILLPLLFVAIGVGVLWFLYRPTAKPPASTVAQTVRPFRAGAMLIGFFAIFFLFGLGVMIPFFVRPALQVVEARSWRPVTCEILSSGVRTHPGEDSDTYSVEALYRYEIDGREHRSGRYQFMGGSSGGYEAKAEAAARIPAGAEVTCYVDPDDPFDAVIERGFTTDYLFGLVPLLFVGVGLGGMIFAGAAARGMKKEAARPSWPKGIVRLGDRSSAGAITTFEPLILEPRMGRFGKLGCATAVALFWNGIVSLFVWQLIESWGTGNPDWFLALFLVPFVLVGLLLLSGIPYGILALANPRPRLRLSRAAIVAGEPVEIDWSFKGAASRVRRLKLWLEASRTRTEIEVHDRGGSVSTNTEVIDTVEILDRGRSEPLEFGAVSFTLPPGKPPTSEGDEAISWKLKLEGEIAYWPDVGEEYEIRVLAGASSDS